MTVPQAPPSEWQYVAAVYLVVFVTVLLSLASRLMRKTA